MSDDLQSFLLQQENELEPATKLETLPLGTLLHGLTHFTESNCIHAHCFVIKIWIHWFKNTVTVGFMYTYIQNYCHSGYVYTKIQKHYHNVYRYT